jgi:uncharacterized protein (DUF1684 family)
MKRKTIFSILVVAIIGVTIFNFITAGENGNEYSDRIDDNRVSRDRFMKSNSSPLMDEDKVDFEGLKYFPVDPTLKIRARLILAERKLPVLITTTTGEQRKYITIGHAEFELEGKPQRLLVYQDFEERNGNVLSLMFADETSALTTYGGGRYVELKKDSNKAITIDFNMAYNPFCHFNDEYSCPIPPKENLMTVAIEAGEKLYKAF